MQFKLFQKYMKNKILYLLIFSLFNSCEAPEIPVVCAFSLTKIEQCFHRNSLLVNFSQFVLKHSLEFSQPALYHPALIFIYFTLYCTKISRICLFFVDFDKSNFYSPISTVFFIKMLELLFRHRFHVFTAILKIES